MSDLRALLAEAKKKRSAQREPPKFAKWMENGQLQCILCGKHVRDEMLWPAHLKTQAHLQAVAEW